MTLLYDRIRNSPPSGVAPLEYGGDDIGFFEAVRQGYRNQVYGMNSDTYSHIMAEELRPVIETIEEREGLSFSNPGEYFGGITTHGRMAIMDEAFLEADQFVGRAESPREIVQERALGRLLGHLRSNLELYPEYNDLTAESLDSRIMSRAHEAVTASQVLSKKTGALGKIGQFVGEAGGVVTDDSFLEAMALFGPVTSLPSAGRGLAQIMLREAIVGAGVEAVYQPSVMNWYKELGFKYTYKDFITSVGVGGLFGAALPAAFAGTGKAVRLTTKQVRDGLEAFRYRAPKDTDVVLDVLDDTDALSAGIPKDVEQQLHETGKIGVEPEIMRQVDGMSTEGPKMRPAVNDEVVDRFQAENLDFELLADDAVVWGESGPVSGVEIKMQLRQDQVLLNTLKVCA